MSIQSRARVTAIGTYVPTKVLSNHDFEQMLDTDDQWIVQRTGIRERRIAEPEEFTSHLCYAAIEDLMKRYNKSVRDVDFIIVCTSTPDYAFPSVASQIQSRFQIELAGAVDLQAACAGFGYGLHMANGMVSSGLHRKVLVVGAETMSKVMDYTDRTTCILFGDGAGAVLVEYDEESPSFLASHTETKGEGGVHLYRSGLSTRMGETELKGNGCLVQNGREVYKWAVSSVSSGLRHLAEKAGLTLDEIDWFVPHSANLRMIESICDRSGFPLEKTLYSLEYFANTSSATIPLSIDIGLREGKVKNGDTMLLYGFGGGLVQAGVLLRWNPS